MPSSAAVAIGEDFEPITSSIPTLPTPQIGSDFVPIGSDFEPVTETPSQDDGGVFHRLMNDVREFGSSAGKYIFHGLQGISTEQAKMLANPVPEMYQSMAEETLLAPERQAQLEQQRITALKARVPDAEKTAAYWQKRAAESDAQSEVDPQLAQTWDARISRAGGGATVMGMESLIPFAGLPIMAMNGAAASEAEALNAGKTPAEAENAAVRSLVGLGIFGGAAKGAALGVAKLLPEGSSTLTKFIGQFLGQDAANEASSRATTAWEAANDAPTGQKLAAATKALTNTTLENSTLNAIYAGIGAAHATGGNAPPTDIGKDFEPLSAVPDVTSRAGGYSAAATIESQPPIAPPSASAPEWQTIPETRRAEFDRLNENLANINADSSATAPPIETPTTITPQTFAPETQTQVAPEAGFPVRPVATGEIASRPDLMQFKQMDDTATGINSNDQITAPYDPVKAGNLLLWEPLNKQEYGLNPQERYIVANGHHRNAAAVEQGVPFQNAQIVRESAGYSAGDARSLAAEANIADGKGTIYDQARFIREQAASGGPDAAMARARQIGARSRAAATIGIEATPDLYTSFINEQITPDQTRAIAEAAPKDAALQRLGISRAVAGDSPADVANFVQAVKARTGANPTARQIDLFGSDDTAIRQAEMAAKRASAIQREISDQISAVAGAARRPEKAAALGVDVRDPASVQAKLVELQGLRERARNWAGDQQIRDIALHGDIDAEAAVRRLSSQSTDPSLATVQEARSTAGEPVPPRLRAGERGTAELFQGQDQPFNLAGQTGFDFAARQAQSEADTRAAADALAAHEARQSKLFEETAGQQRVREGEYVGDITPLRRETNLSGARPATPPGPADVSSKALATLHERLAQRSEFVVGNRRQLANEIRGSVSDEALTRAGITKQVAREYARTLIASYEDAVLSGALPTQPRLPIYRADYARNRAQYELAGRFAYRAVTDAMARLGFAPKTHIYASGTATPRRSAPPVATTTSATITAPPAHLVLNPLKSWWQAKTLGLRKVIAPQTIDDKARTVANIIRDYNGHTANYIAQADAALSDWRTSFDRTPVPRDWQYDPKKPLPRNYAFMAESEKGGAGLTPNERALKAQLDSMFAETVDEVHRVKPAALQTLIQDYFPHVWKDLEQAKRVFTDIVGNRSLEGGKTFLKQRTLAYIEDGLKRGLRPVSDNPIDIALTKLHEVRKFVAAQDILREAKDIGARKFVYVFEKPPDGWLKVDDPTSTVHGPPFVTVPEAFDEQMRVKTAELLDQLGIPHERVTRLGGKRWGTFETGGAGVRTRFAGPLSVYWHELGHGLQERYAWIDQILPGVALGGKSQLATELRNLADLRFEGQTATKSFQKYVRTKDEKAAVMLEAYVHAPDKMKAVAPTIYERVRQFIADRPELHPIEEIRPSLNIGTAKQQIPVGGMVTLGHYYMPEGPAAVLTNYLSPGLQRFGVIRNLRTASNILNAAQLGMSAFHAGFTSIDAAVSTWALGLKNLSEGKILTGVKRIVTSPLAPVANYYTGKAIQTAMLHPDWAGELKMLGLRHQLSPEGTARADEIAQLAVQAGLRATVDPFWKTQITRNMLRAWNEGGVRGFSGTVLRLPFAVSEQLRRPILEYLVPRQKLGVFAGMARNAMDRLGPNADIHSVRAAMALAADATEDRMGQMTYDNLFYNRMVKDAALMGFRAYGWTYGKYRALLGGVSDTLRTPARIARGEPLLTDRMAYLVALPMLTAAIGSTMNYLLTGQTPQDWRDLFMPRTGKLDTNGNPQRISPPTYLKDFLSDWHDAPNLKKMLGSFYHKLNPWISIGTDIVRNADFYNMRIYNPSEPALKQMADAVGHVLKSAEPFSVTGAAKLSQAGRSSISDYLLPFFGFVPAKAALTMTAAQSRAAELYRDTLPAGARTPEQVERSQLLRDLIMGFKTDPSDPGARFKLLNAVRSGQLQPADLQRIETGIRFTPLQYQVNKLGLADAMKVWDLANPQERAQIHALVATKFATNRTLSAEQKLQYLRAFRNSQ